MPNTWLTVKFRIDGTELELPFYYVGGYSVSGGNSIQKPQVLGSRQPAFKNGTNAVSHKVTGMAYGFGKSVASYREILNRADKASSCLVALVFPTNRLIEAPLLLEDWSFTETEYGLGTGEPTRADVSLTLTSI